MKILQATGCLMVLLALVACQDDALPQGLTTDSADAQVRNRGADKDRWWDALPRPQWSAFSRLDDDTGWFEVYRVQPGVIAIYEPGQFEEVISYLILGETRALLFDTGLGIGAIDAVLAPLTDLPLVVLNSHSHYDHIGGNYLFDVIYGLDNAYTAARAMGLDHAAVAGAVAEGWIWKDTPADFDAATFRSRGYEISEFVGEASVIDLGGRRLEVLLTPGHAPDSLCLLDRENRLLFVGDTFYPAPLYTHIAGSNFDDYVVSANRLATIAPVVDYLLPGHNVGLVGAEYLLRMAQGFAQIGAGMADYIVTDGNRQYQFDGFSIIVAGTPAAILD